MKTMLGLLVLTLPIIAVADRVVPVDEVESFVNIREAPEAGSEIVGRLQKDTPLQLVASKPGWHEVQLEGADTTGFVSADWSQVIPDDTPEADSDLAEVDEPEDETTPVETAVAEDTAEDGVVESVAETVPDDRESADATDSEPAEDEAVDEHIRASEPAEQTARPEMVANVGGVPGPPGPQGPPGEGTLKGKPGYLVRFKRESEGETSQIYDNGNQVGIGTTEPEQRLEVNGNIQINEQSSSVAGLFITQSGGDTGYIMHNAANTLAIGAGSIDRITIDRDGNIGFGVSRLTHPFELASGAHVTAGGVWTNNSSRADKENIRELRVDDAVAALAQLEPVRFNYKADVNEAHVGFIAEDVPELVAMADRQGLSTMDIVAVLTRVIQDQQKRIEALEARIAE